MKKLITILAGAFLCVSGLYAADGQVFYAEDAAPAIRIHNTGSEVVTIFINAGGASATNAITIGDASTTIDGSGNDDTVAEFAALIEACTNSAGQTPLEVDTGCAVATTESTDGELLDELATVNIIRAGAWGSVKWDTSDVLHFRTYIPAASGGAGRSGVLVKSVYGNAGGTSNLTLKAYLNGTKVYERDVTSPLFVSALSDGTDTNIITAADFVVPIEFPVGVYVGASDKFIMEAARDTTGTTGGIGVRTDSK